MGEKSEWLNNFSEDEKYNYELKWDNYIKFKFLPLLLFTVIPILIMGYLTQNEMGSTLGILWIIVPLIIMKRWKKKIINEGKVKHN